MVFALAYWTGLMDPLLSLLMRLSLAKSIHNGLPVKAYTSLCSIMPVYPYAVYCWDVMPLRTATSLITSTRIMVDVRRSIRLGQLERRTVTCSNVTCDSAVQGQRFCISASAATAAPDVPGASVATTARPTAIGHC